MYQSTRATLMEDQTLHDDRDDVVVGHQGPDVDIIELPQRDLVDAGERTHHPELLPQRSADQPGDISIDDEDERAAAADRPGQGVDDPGAQLAERREPGPMVPVDGEGESVLAVLQVYPPQPAPHPPAPPRSPGPPPTPPPPYS